MKVGIVGFPGSGKTTIFNALTGLKAQTGPYGKEGSPHLGAIKVPDKRLEVLSEIFKPKKTTYAEITFVDFAIGKSEKALDAATVNQIKDADTLAQVARAFANPMLADPADPLKEVRDFQDELKLIDLGVIENRLSRLKKEKGREQEKELLERCRAWIEEEKALRSMSFGPEETKMLAGYGFLSQKPLLILVNVEENDLNQPLPVELADYLKREQLEAVILSGKVEMDLAQMEEGERLEFLKELGLAESARDRFVHACYARLDLISFLTTGEDEVRAWSIKRGTPALKAAGKIHSDIERGFIRAEVVAYEDFVQYGSEAKCKEAGKLRLEGKDYIVQDGDIVHFRFNI